jgi:hypothetical protein
MKVETPQIYWQGDREAIMSIDFLPFSDFFATCGYDSEESMFIRFWQWEHKGRFTLRTISFHAFVGLCRQ